MYFRTENYSWNSPLLFQNLWHCLTLSCMMLQRFLKYVPPFFYTMHDRVKGCVRDIFAKEEHLQNEQKRFLFHFTSTALFVLDIIKF